MSGRTFYITTAIPYANGAPHIGHAYERIATDAIARFKRLDGYDVLFVTGMDEHGLKMQQTAQREGITPKELADRTAAQFMRMGEVLEAPADDVVRTTEERHKRASQAIWEGMQAAGDIYLSKYAGWYSVRDEAYYGEDELTLANDGGKVAPTGSPVEWVEEESYFFRLSAYADRLLRHYEDHPDFITPEKYKNELVAFIKRGLADLSISRTTFAWGVPVPSDPKHVMYVWVDALTNYITATGYPDANAPRAKFWPADAHVIGKDITRFHAIYWPALLMSAGIAVPKQIVVHGFLFNRGEKMSKSVGNVIDPFTLAKHYGTDQLRYFFLREVPFGQDGNYSHEAIVQRINADLANDLGNLAQRSLSMIARNCECRVPTPDAFMAADETILAEAYAIGDKARAAMRDYALHQALAEIWHVVAQANRYFAAEEPWVKRKSDPARMATILYITAEVLRVVAIFVQPFMPAKMGELLDLLAIPADARSFDQARRQHRLAPEERRRTQG
jgi:methionyl-tRNA synthetase